jgi:hypothetical protein
MALAAAQVVDAIAARITGLALTGARVYTSRTWPLAEKDLPAWRVVAMDEAIAPKSLGPNPTQEHQLQVELRGHARAVADLDDALHGLAEQALKAVFPATPAGTPDALDGMARKIHLSLRRIERVLQMEGEATLGVVIVSLLIVFMTKAQSPDALA